MKTSILIFAAMLLSGCAGLNTTWRFQMDMIYMTPQEKPAPTPIPAGKAS